MFFYVEIKLKVNHKYTEIQGKRKKERNNIFFEFIIFYNIVRVSQNVFSGKRTFMILVVRAYDK